MIYPPVNDQVQGDISALVTAEPGWVNFGRCWSGWSATLTGITRILRESDSGGVRFDGHCNRHWHCGKRDLGRDLPETQSSS